MRGGLWARAALLEAGLPRYTTPTPPPPQADQANHLLRHVNLTSGLVTTLAGSRSGNVGADNYGHSDGIGMSASFYTPTGVALDAAGTVVVVVSKGLLM